MIQPQLFGPPDAYGSHTPAARSSDPPTSHEAAANATESGRRQRHAEIVLAIVRRRPGSTYVELFAAATDVEQRELGDAYEAMRRLNDLCKAGLVCKSEARVCCVKGSRMTTWNAI